MDDKPTLANADRIDKVLPEVVAAVTALTNGDADSYLEIFKTLDPDMRANFASLSITLLAGVLYNVQTFKGWTKEQATGWFALLAYQSAASYREAAT